MQQPTLSSRLAWNSRSLGRHWRHRPGRIHARWTNQLCHNDTGLGPANLWTPAVQHGGVTLHDDDNVST